MNAIERRLGTKRVDTCWLSTIVAIENRRCSKARIDAIEMNELITFTVQECKRLIWHHPLSDSLSFLFGLSPDFLRTVIEQRAPICHATLLVCRENARVDLAWVGDGLELFASYFCAAANVRRFGQQSR